MMERHKKIKNILRVFFLLSLFFLSPIYAAQNTQMSNKQVVKNLFSTFANTHSTANDLDKFLSKKYVEVSDGHKLNYPQFMSYVEKLHHMMKSMHVKFIQIVSDGDIVATHHITYCVKQNGKVVKTEIFGFFTVKNHKVVSSQQISRMIKGDKNDKDLLYKS